MDMAREKEKWMATLLYLVFLSFSVHLLHSHFFDKLIVHLDRVTVKRTPKLPLRFRSDGTFKILQVADMHYGNGLITRCRDVSRSEFRYCSDLNTSHFVRRLIEAEKPDFLAFTGDNIFGPSAADAAESLFKAFTPAMESRLPWAAILGNHDQESTMSREELMSLISLLDYSVSQVNPFADDSSNPQKKLQLAKIDGFGNYNVAVQGAVGSPMENSTVLNLLFLDSGDRATVEGRQTYGWIKRSQLQWMYSISQEIKDDNSDHNHQGDFPLWIRTPPALTFFHIPIPEIRQLYVQKIVGQFQEGVACSSVNSGVLQALVLMDNVKAVFIGHDHINDFCGNLSGIWFCYGGGSGYHGYGLEGWHRRARVILLELSKGKKSWMGVRRISTWKRLDDEVLNKIDEQALWEEQPSI